MLDPVYRLVGKFFKLSWMVLPVFIMIFMPTYTCAACSVGPVITDLRDLRVALASVRRPCESIKTGTAVTDITAEVVGCGEGRLCVQLCIVSGSCPSRHRHSDQGEENPLRSSANGYEYFVILCR
jgi:hypothetical protein